MLSIDRLCNRSVDTIKKPIKSLKKDVVALSRLVTGMKKTKTFVRTRATTTMATRNEKKKIVPMISQEEDQKIIVF